MKVKFGSIITDGVNKIGGHVVSKNHYGRYIKNYVIPVNPQTSPQQARRAIQGFLTSNWRSLTPVQRNQWTAETANYPKIDSLGNIYFLTGQSLYISLNLYIWSIGASLIATPSTKVIPLDIQPFTIAYNALVPTLTITYSAIQLSPTSRLLIYATRGLSAGINVVTTELRSIAIRNRIGQITDSVSLAYNSYFGIQPAGSKCFVKIIPIQTLSGTTGTPYIASAISI